MKRREEVARALEAIHREISPFESQLIVVTKTYPIEDVAILQDLGESNFGENRSSEGLSKSREIPATWHYQGQIQSNKIREILSWADVIHSLDQESHLMKMHSILQENESIGPSVFLQMSLDGDPSRGGTSLEDAYSLAEKIYSQNVLTLKGLMCVPPPEWEIERAFTEIAVRHHAWKERFPDAPYLSAGMSNDYMTALTFGATHIRIGSKILGQRHYDR